MSESPLYGKGCLITGATGGLGRELAKAFGQAGCRLFLTSRREGELQALKSTLAQSTGGQVLYRAVDLADPAQVEDLVLAVQAEWGTLGLLVNSAGVFPVGPLLEAPIGAYEACFNLNVRAPLLLCRAFGAGMIQAGWGRIINIASSSAYAGFPGSSLYCASKHALLGLSRALHAEWKVSGVRVFCVSPGSIDTAMARVSVDQDPSTFLDPAEVARFIVDLVSYDGAMVAEEVRLNRMVLR